METMEGRKVAKSLTVFFFFLFITNARKTLMKTESEAF